MKGRARTAIGVTALAGVLAMVSGTPGALAAPRPGVRHVLLISVDGMHQSDLAWYVAHHRRSTLAKLASRGTDYSDASTPVPSDSFPGLLAQVTGGNPSSTGVYYDDSYDHQLLPAGRKNCAGVAPGAEVNYSEALDKNPDRLDAGQGLPGLPDSILQMTGTPKQVIDKGALPVDPATCKPVYPNDYLKVNTVFEVAKAHGLVTAWSDKHPAYQILDGPSGHGIDDEFTPEVNSQVPGLAPGVDWTKDNLATRQYDGYKVQAVKNWIDGFDHSRSVRLGAPAIFGMNFQSVSTAQKLPSSDGMAGGYLSDGTTPGPLLAGALRFVDDSLGSLVSEIHDKGLDASTDIVVSAKHGQSPQEPDALTRIPDGPILDALNAAWAAQHPGAPDLVAHAVDDDIMLVWFSDRSPEAARFASQFLLSQSGVGNDIAGNPKPYTSSGLAFVYAGADAARFFGVPHSDPRVPDLVGIVQHGVVYTGGQGKIAEHGGADPQDRNVPILISGPGVPNNLMVTDPVETTQVAPTILHLLGIDPGELQAVQLEHTAVLPRVSSGSG
jgi:hypothetical protein